MPLAKSKNSTAAAAQLQTTFASALFTVAGDVKEFDVI
jgi:hypothetical protein